jgi:hypothetical protein
MSSNRGMQHLNDRVGQWEIHLSDGRRDHSRTVTSPFVAASHLQLGERRDTQVDGTPNGATMGCCTIGIVATHEPRASLVLL